MVEDLACLDSPPAMGRMDCLCFWFETTCELGSLAQIAWHKSMQACRARWQTQRIDPSKGPPKIPEAFVKLGMAQQCGLQVTWNFKLPAGIVNAISRRVSQEGMGQQLSLEEGREQARSAPEPQ